MKDEELIDFNYLIHIILCMQEIFLAAYFPEWAYAGGMVVGGISSCLYWRLKRKYEMVYLSIILSRSCVVANYSAKFYREIFWQPISRIRLMQKVWLLGMLVGV